MTMTNGRQTALVTGGNKGIGLEICRQLGKRGFHVFLAARDKDRGLKAAAELQQAGLQVNFVQLDVSNSKSIQQAANEIEQSVGHLNVLINNAGIYEDSKVTILETSPDLIRRTLETNTLAPLIVVQSFLPLLLKSESARIINISSGMGALSDMEGDAPAYSISKTALNAVTRQLAAALQQKNIPVNSVCPGWVRTDMGGSQAPRSVQQGADTAVWLASEAPIDKTGGFWRDRSPINW